MNKISPIRLDALRGAADLDDLYAKVDQCRLTPGWVPREIPILWQQPRTEYLPAHWSYDEAKAGLDAAGRLIDVRLAERRNLLMRNPRPDTNFATNNTFVCAYQMILPGEEAPSHRHAPHALRLILEAEGCYSVVNGEKVPMETGDVVLTPGWHWHSHGHEGSAPGYWLDVLDVPLVHLLEPMFYEEHPNRFEPDVKPVESSPFRFRGADLERALESAQAEPDGTTGPRIVLPAPSMPPFEIAMQRLESGKPTRRFRSTANQIFCVVSGCGETRVENSRFTWSRGDTIVVPCWKWHEHEAAEDAVLFSVTDDPLLRWSKYDRREVS